MSIDNQDPHNYQPSTKHHQPSSPATSNHHLHGFTTLHLPQTPPSSSSPTTPESLIAAALGRAINNTKSTSFQDALTTTTTNTTTTNNLLARQLSDATSSVTQYLSATTTPPKIPMQNVLRRANTDMITYERQEQPDARTRSHQPIRRALSDAVEYHYQQPPQKTRTPPPRVSASPIATPESSAGKRSPQLEKMKKIEDIVKEIEQRCLDIIGQDEQVEDEIPEPPKPKEQEECVGVERLKNGDLRFVLSCACGKRFEMLLKNNGYCFYRFT